MADIKYKYTDALHLLNSYDNIVLSYAWIKDALGYLFQTNEKASLRCAVGFESDDMTYDCRSFDEFKKYAFGKNINLKYMQIYVTENWVTSLITVYASYKGTDTVQEFVISSEDEMLIINLKEALQTCKKAPPKAKETVIMNVQDNSIHIGNNNTISNSVIGNDNEIEDVTVSQVAEQPVEKWYQKLFWKLFIPVAVIVIGAAICVWLNIN